MSSARRLVRRPLAATPPTQATRRRLTAFYRADAAYAAQQASHDRAYFRRFLDVTAAALPRRPLRVLEVGAGAGEALTPLVETRPELTVTAVELSTASLARMRAARDGRLQPVAGDALDLPLAAGTVDAVVAFEVIEHLVDVPAALDEMLRVLRRPGYLVFGLPNHGSLWTPVEDALRGRRRLAFDVDGRRGAWRWWGRNLALAVRKRLRPEPTFFYRDPVLTRVAGGDGDAVYYCCPLDVTRYLRRRGARLVESAAWRRFGALGRWVPLEFQGSAVLAWRIER